MEKDKIDVFDIPRILFGQVPPEFYIELIIRSLVVYLMITFGMKAMGKRVSADLNRTELAGLSTLAAATGLIILAPDRGILPALVVLGVLLAAKRYVDYKNYRKVSFEHLVEGQYSVLVIDGVLQLKEMWKARITKEQLFAQLRGMEIIHLGKVKRLYLEASGEFSVIENEGPTAGLPVIPPWDGDFIKEQHFTNQQVCGNCGTLQTPADKKCKTCGRNEFATAITEQKQPKPQLMAVVD
jgi:uncharacterized membrane protein YcaP (DUF421 family)